MRRFHDISFLALLFSAAVSVATFAQTRTGVDVPAATRPYTASVPPSPKTETIIAPVAVTSDYVLGAGDQISVVVADLESDFAGRAFRVDMSGELTLPYAGRLHAAGLTTPGLENEIRARLTRILKDPQVVVSISSYGSQPVSVLGAVNNPGVRQIEGRKTLFEVLSIAGGLRPDAGYLIRISRDDKWGPLPIPGAQHDTTGGVSTASIKVKNIMNATNAGENILIYPGDSISVPKADLVYAVGSVTKPGGFPLNEHESLSALQVVSLAEGLQKTAAPDKAKILRLVDGSPRRTEIPVNLKQLMGGKTSDINLQAGDILFIPHSNAKSAGYRTLDTITGAAGAAIIYTK
jgi:polysaccharide export outer membrane protein